MNEFFFPKNIAIYGVSSAPGNIGVGILDNLERFSFKGNVFLIGEKGGSVRGKNIAKSIEEIEIRLNSLFLSYLLKASPTNSTNAAKRGFVMQSSNQVVFLNSGQKKRSWKMRFSA